ncbi:ribonuclease toxin immunity protein CdiI [Apibacter adventoris]|uniref:ribonuclease toxin immunity protein CdiI n=1 Tax=Apibacter adventoris TaxID=1679466 RepID=UPI0015E29AD4
MESGFEETSINFPEEAEEWVDEPFIGVEFGILEKELSIPNEDFIKYLRIVCDGYNEGHPQQKEEVEKLFNTIKVNFISKNSSNSQ